MAISANIKDMQESVVDWVKANMPRDINRAYFGTVHGNKIIIGNRSYDYIPTVDLYFEDGDSVACIMPNGGNTVAVVGVL